MALDLDGTLFNSKGQVSERTAAALKHAHEAGIVLAPATARWYQAAIRPFAALEIEAAAIASAGADVRSNDGTVLEQTMLDGAYAPEWMKPVTTFEGVHIASVLSVLAEATTGDAHLPELEAWRDRVSIYSALAFNGDALLTMTAPGTDKGSGLLALCRSLGIDPAEAVAIGDSEVDVPMFRVAGMAVAMGDATEEARAAATHRTGTADEDGVAEFLESIV